MITSKISGDYTSDLCCSYPASMPNQHVSIVSPLFELAQRRDFFPSKIQKSQTSCKTIMSYSKFTENISSSPLLTENEWISASTKLELAQQTRTKVAREAVKHEPNLRRLVALCNTLDAYADDLREFHTSETSEEPWISEEDAEVKPYSIYSEVQVQVTECESDSDSEHDDDDEDDWSEYSSDEERDEDSWSDNSAETMVGDDDEELSKGFKDMWLQPASLKNVVSWTSEDLFALGTRRAVQVGG